MKAHYGLPSGDYNIILSKEELAQIISKGSVCMRVSRTLCTTSRAELNKVGDGLDFLDKKEIYNDLRFNLDEPVADIACGYHNIQYLTIILESEENK